MGSRMKEKEEEKNEKTIRGLLKLPSNRRCINCNSMVATLRRVSCCNSRSGFGRGVIHAGQTSLRYIQDQNMKHFYEGPQYVCTSFSTFICTNCSGIHREFTHRVKSISMAKFTSQEVSALQEGGNERAKEIYFKHWDSQHQSVPDSSDVDRLRNFIKNVYVDRRYTGERIVDRPPQVKGDGEGSYGNSNGGSYRGVSGTYEHNYSEQHSTGSAAYDQSNLIRRSAAGGTDQEDKTTNGTDKKNFENHRSPDESPKLSGRSENHLKGASPSSYSVVEPSKDIRVGIPPIRLPDPHRSHRAMTPNISAQEQNTASSRTNDPSSGTRGDIELVMSRSLIDFDSDPQPPQAGVQNEMQKNSPLPSTDVGWATFDVATPEKATVVPPSSSANTLESQLLQLSNSGSAPPSGFSTVSTAKFSSFPMENHGDQQHQLSMFPASNMQSNNPALNRPGSAPVSNQLWEAASLAPVQGTSTLPASQASHIMIRTHESVGGVTSRPPSVEASSSGRTALPEDLFTMRYPPVSTSVWGWQTSPHVNMGYGPYSMQYPAGPVNFPLQTTPTFAHARLINPFGTVHEPRLAHASTFPSLTSIQGALPDMGNRTALSRASSMESIGSQWLPPQQIPYSSAANPSPYMVQQRAVNMPHRLPNNLFPIGYQAAGGFGTTGSTYGLYGMDQQMAAQNPQSVDQNHFPRIGGNPFL